MSSSEFRHLIYQLVRQIPAGQVATYGQLAVLSGHPHSARVVGYYLKTNPDIPATPCHRVVAADGSLTGYVAGGVDVKKQLLLSEGVVFQGNKVNLKISRWQTPPKSSIFNHAPEKS